MSEESIILTMLQRLDERLEDHTERTIARLFAIETRQEGMRVELVGVNRRLDTGNERMDEANHRTSKNEARLDAIERGALVGASIAADRAERRRAFRSRFERAWKLIWSPAAKVIAAATLLTAGFTLSQIREVWPW